MPAQHLHLRQRSADSGAVMKPCLKIVDSPLSTEEQLRLAFEREDRLLRELADVRRVIEPLRRTYAKEKHGCCFMREEAVRRELGL